MTTGTAIQQVNRETGEVVVTEAFDFGTYLTGLGDQGVKRQQQLAAAYDAACAALVGPNDVQVEGGRSFKKKSAWRKLGRHFGISTEVLGIEREWLKDDFLATVRVRAIAPWGQHTDAVGACGTDEETGRRTITVADAIATAETRATNRAISNLIAMGEVSAEEMNKERGPRTRSDTGKAPGDKLMPFGKHKTKKLGEIDVTELQSTVSWCREKDATKFADLIAACEAVIREKAGQAEPAEAEELDEEGLPF